MYIDSILQIIPREYLFFLGAILLCAVFSAVANARVFAAYGKYNRVRPMTGASGFDAARHLLFINNASDIGIGMVRGTLSDHYHPRKKVVNLSESTYRNCSVSAVAVAAHEVGHVMQKKDGYLFYRIRTFLVPVVNFGSRLAMPLVLVGLLLDYYSWSSDPEMGFKLAMLGVLLYGGALVFALVTLPVELNASRRAKKMLLESGLLTVEELHGAGKVLSAAAMTYLASLLTSLVYFLRFLAQVLLMFGRSDSRR